MNNLSLEFHLGHLGLLNFYLTIQKFSIELRIPFWYRIYHQSKLDVLLVNRYEKLLIKLEMKTNFRVFRVFENNLSPKRKRGKCGNFFFVFLMEALVCQSCCLPIFWFNKHDFSHFTTFSSFSAFSAFSTWPKRFW